MLEIDFKEYRNRCPKCGSSNLKSKGSAAYNSPLGESGTKTKYKCNDCGHEYVVITRK